MLPTPIQGFIFDMDGTLVDTMPICVQCLQDTIAQYTGRSLNEAEIHALFGPSEEGILRKVLGDRASAAYADYLVEYERMHQDGRQIIFPGILDLLARLRDRGLRVAIATGKGPATAAITLRCSGLAPYVERVETGFLEGGNKPTLIKRVLEGWSMPPAQAAYVGDMPSDMRDAQQAGVLPVGAAWDAAGTLASIHPNGWLVFKRVEEFIAWIK